MHGVRSLQSPNPWLIFSDNLLASSEIENPFVRFACGMRIETWRDADELKSQIRNSKEALRSQTQNPKPERWKPKGEGPKAAAPDP
jgi:hypothetical protein